jgi:hypothetical protein
MIDLAAAIAAVEAGRAQRICVPTMALRPYTPYGAGNKLWNLWWPFALGESA